MIFALNIIGFVLCGGFITFLTVALFKAEKKLAKYGESTLFKKKDKEE